jgi:hypothetical protein
VDSRSRKRSNNEFCHETRLKEKARRIVVERRVGEGFSYSPWSGEETATYAGNYAPAKKKAPGRGYQFDNQELSSSQRVGMFSEL